MSLSFYNVLNKNNTIPKIGEFIVWPENISIDNGQQHQNSKQKLLNATSIGKHFNVSSQRLNLILTELGWIEKAYIGQDVNGWAITKLGKSIGGRQFEHETAGGAYVLWPENIFQNKSINEVFHENPSIDKTIPQSTTSLSQTNKWRPPGKI